jgi:hypothetical protein
MPRTGRWQFAVDDGPWQAGPAPTGVPDNALHRFAVAHGVRNHVRIRGHDGAQYCIAPIAGITVYATAEPSRGALLHNLGRGQQLLAEVCRPTEGDPLALLDDLRPDLVTVLFSNDVRFQSADRFSQLLQRLLGRVAPYADALLIAPFEQRPPRIVGDAVTVRGSTVVESPSALFTITDHNAPVRGTNLVAGASIESVESPTRVTVSDAATGTSSGGELVIGRYRNSMIQATYRAFTKAVAERVGCGFIDLFEAWSDKVGPGWDAAYAAGLMFDGLHPTQLGHDDIAARVKAAVGLATTVVR